MSGLFAIEKGIPVPPHGNGSTAKYPWADLCVGDSFFVPGVKTNAMVGSKAHAAKKHNAKYSMRSVDGGVRIWRIE